MQGRIKAIRAKAEYTQCYKRNHNCIVVSVFKLLIVRNILDKVLEVTNVCERLKEDRFVRRSC